MSLLEIAKFDSAKLEYMASVLGVNVKDLSVPVYKQYSGIYEVVPPDITPEKSVLRDDHDGCITPTHDYGLWYVERFYCWTANDGLGQVEFYLKGKLLLCTQAKYASDPFVYLPEVRGLVCDEIHVVPEINHLGYTLMCYEIERF